MNLKELQEIIRQVVENDIAELEYEKSGTRVRIRRDAVGASGTQSTRVELASHPSANRSTDHAPTPESGTESTEENPSPAEELHSILSPIVGTFYRSPSPGKPPFVKIGDQVEVGTVLCIVEAMKLMNEIESDVAGEIIKIPVENNQPVEYGHLLFGIRPRR